MSSHSARDNVGGPKANLPKSTPVSYLPDAHVNCQQVDSSGCSQDWPMLQAPVADEIKEQMSSRYIIDPGVEEGGLTDRHGPITCASLLPRSCH